MKRVMTHRAGFTIIELLVVMAIFVIVMLALYNFFISSNSEYLAQQAFISANYSATTAMNEIQAAALPADHVLASFTYGANAYTSGTTTLILELPSIDSSGNVITNTFDDIVFYSTGSTLYESDYPDANSDRRKGTRQLTNASTTAAFTYDSTDFTTVKSLTVDIQTQNTVKDKTIRGHLRQAVYLRNTN